MLPTLMKMLQPPYNHYLAACAGWLELGDVKEAAAELNQLPPELNDVPQVIEARWQVAACQNSWEEALHLAHKLVELLPENPTGWLHRAYAMRRCPSGSIEKARDALLPAWGRFPEEPTIPYNMACYACQLGRLEEARLWFSRAVDVGGKVEMQSLALSDSDLEPMWGEIRSL